MHTCELSLGDDVSGYKTYEDEDDDEDAGVGVDGVVR